MHGREMTAMDGTMLRRMSYSIGIIVVGLVVGGCTVQVTTQVEPDGSGVLRTEIGFTESDLELLQSFESEFSQDEICQEIESDDQVLTFRQELRDDGVWCVGERSFDDLDELQGIYEEMDSTVNELRVEGGTFYYDVEPDIGEEQQEDFGFTPRTVWELQAPGGVIDSNADEVDGRTLRWELELGERSRLTAQTRVGGISPTIWIALGLGALFLCGGAVVAGGAGLWWYRKRSRPA